MQELAGYRARGVELWGHGAREAWSGEGPLTLAAESRVIAEAPYDNEVFHLVGHSYGGAVALRFALGQMQRLASLTLIEPSSFHLLKSAGSEARLLDEIRRVADTLNVGVLSGDYHGSMERFIDYWGGAGTWASLPPARRTQLAQRALHVAHHFWALIEEPTPLAAYRALDVPTMILCGTHSPEPSRAISRLLAEAIPNAKHRTIRGADHMAAVTRPNDVNPIILSHVKRNVAEGRRSTRQSRL